MSDRTSPTPVPATARLFLALCPPPAVQAALAAWRAHWTWPSGATLPAPEGLHITLHFIGPLPRERVPELVARLALPAPRFTLAFSRAELWPRGLAVVCPDTLPAPLAELHARLADALRAAALPVEARRFRPHLTLARKAANAGMPSEPLALRWSVRGYALMESRQGYHRLAHFG